MFAPRLSTRICSIARLARFVGVRTAARALARTVVPDGLCRPGEAGPAAADDMRAAGRQIDVRRSELIALDLDDPARSDDATYDNRANLAGAFGGALDLGSD
jgi:hypothetical protein